MRCCHMDALLAPALDRIASPSAPSRAGSRDSRAAPPARPTSTPSCARALAAAEAARQGVQAQLDHQQLLYRELAAQARARPGGARRARAPRAVRAARARPRAGDAARDADARSTTSSATGTTQFGTLAEQLRRAHESDEALRATTESLASALRSGSTRGVWGETQLRRVVEAAGLTRYVDFDTQTSITSDAGAGRPDMVIRLPGDKAIAVDAKVPLDAYLEASAIPLTAQGAEAARRKTLLEKHVKAVRAHVDALAKKTYWAGLPSSPEFVVCFVPSESLLAAALEEDPSLLDYAFGKRVALASPVNLWAVLKTVAYTWTQQDVSQEARALFELGNQLYERLGGLAGARRRPAPRDRADRRQLQQLRRVARVPRARQRAEVPGHRPDQARRPRRPATIEKAPRRLTAPELLDAVDATPWTAVSARELPTIGLATARRPRVEQPMDRRRLADVDADRLDRRPGRAAWRITPRD